MTLARQVQLLTVLLIATALFAADAKPQHFQKLRDVQKSSAGTNYFSIDSEIWEHTRADLGDLRLYGDGREIPYALREEGNAEYSERHELKLLNKGIVSGATQFLLDMTGADIYDQVTLEISQHDFDRVATVEGANSADAGTWATLARTPIFDFTKQKLGQNLAISLPASNFHYLRVSISNTGFDRGNDVTPQQVQGATACNTYRSTAIWANAGATLTRAVQTHDSISYLSLPAKVPVDRIHFTVPADRINFRRDVTIETRPEERQFKSDEEGWQPIATGELSRVLSLGGKIHENLDLSTHGARATQWRITVRNGDDPPLPFDVVAQSVERRIYFASQDATPIKLYYDDEKVAPPVYDYAKFFRDADARSAAVVILGPAKQNPSYSPRPDDRPWTERNNWVLWTAMVVAVLGIGAVALRGLKKT